MDDVERVRINLDCKRNEERLEGCHYEYCSRVFLISYIRLYSLIELLSTGINGDRIGKIQIRYSMRMQHAITRSVRLTFPPLHPYVLSFY